MTQFRYNEEEFKKVKKEMILELLFGAFLAVGYIAWLFTLNTPELVYAVAFKDINAVGITLIAMIPFSIYLIKRKKEALLTYQIIIENDLIKIIEDGILPTFIHFKEIKDIHKDKKGNFVIKMNGNRSKVLISKNIDNYNNLDLELKKIKTIDLHTKFDYKEIEPFLPIISFFLMFFIFLLQNKFLLIFLITLLLLDTIWRIKIIIETPALAKKGKKIFLLIFYLLPTIWILSWKF